MNKIISLPLAAASLLLAFTTPTNVLAGGSCSDSAAGYHEQKTQYIHAGYVKNNIVETAVAAGSFKTLAAALKATGLDETLSNDGQFTVFAPTDEAFAKLPAGTLEKLLQNPDQLRQILLLHVVEGAVPASAVVNLKSAKTLNGESLAVTTSTTGVRIGNANVIKTDVKASNGIIHVIDTVLLPTAADAPGNIVEVAAGAGQFTTLLAAAKAAGLADTLSNDGPYTIFAPTDEAFAKLPKGTLEHLLANPDELKSILLYHVVPGTVKAADVVKLTSAKTAQGGSVIVAVKGGTVKIGDATVLKTDIPAKNGVIHVIDTVLIPQKH